MKTVRRAFVVGLLISAWIVCLSAAPGSLRTTVTLVWSYPTNELSTELTFRLYSSTNVAAPLTSWPLLTTVVGTNTSVTLPMDAQQRYFVMTASNYWGESDFSNVTNTPAPPRHVNNLGLK